MDNNKTNNNNTGATSAGLIRLLKVIEESGKDGISTSKLCEQAFKTRNYGMRVINRAYQDGYIRRFGKGKHAQKKINYLSDKGKELLLSQLQE
jgi:hypothetical protein